ncbi:hypothetical protein BC828DRAFT_339358, partial [Blastocladiella britannica]
SAAEVAKHTTEHDCWIVYRRKVYDISLFLHDHPGGPELIVEYAGKDVAALMNDRDIHEHSEGAFDILDDYYIGRLESNGDSTDDEGSDSGTDIVADKSAKHLGSKYRDPESELDAQLIPELATAKRPLMDLNKPLMWQMLQGNFSKEYYLTQVHIPRHLPGPATIFANPVLELLTRTPWYLVPLTWLPVVCWLALESMRAAPADGGAMSLAKWGVHFAGGLFMWTMFEYTFHRFLFHLDALLPDNRYALTLHFLMHGIHHYLPMDHMRLVLPPIFFAIIVQPPWFAFRAFLSYSTCAALFSGGIIGYVMYDLTHYYLHHARVRTEHMREMKKYHLAHHYKNYQAGYGITSKIWDYAFGSLLDY